MRMFACDACGEQYRELREEVAAAERFEPTLFRELWQVHVALTRQVILSVVSHASGEALQEEIKELLGNQQDLGLQLGLAAHDKHFGEAAAALLIEHIVQAKALLEAVVSDAGEATILPLMRKWEENGREIADALNARFNPMHRPEWTAMLRNEMQRHLELTRAEIIFTVEADASASLWVYEQTLHCVERLAETLIFLASRDQRTADSQ